MHYWILKLYEFSTAMVPFILTLIALNVIYRRNGIKSTAGHILLCFVFAFYIYAVFYFTGAATLYDIGRYGFDIRPGEVNLTPFAGGAADLLGGLNILNVLLFVPLGFLLPLAWPAWRRFWAVGLSGLGLSLLIETSQLFNHRTTDIDDLITNTFGAVVGYLLFLLFALVTRRGARQKPAPPPYFRAEPILLFAAMFLGRFLFYNGFALGRTLFN